MKVILKQDIKGVGRKYEIKDVSHGYAGNFLIPKKLAEFATAETIKKYEAEKKASEAETEKGKEMFRKQIESLKGKTISLKKKANEKGHLFEKISKEEIVSAVRSQLKIELDPSVLVLDKPIKEVGEHKIAIEMGSDRGEVVILSEAL